LVTLPLSEAVISSHSCAFTLDGEKHLGIAASRIIPWVKLHWRVESAPDTKKPEFIKQTPKEFMMRVTMMIDVLWKKKKAR
tara:strand:+ start:557 stop:799 length:243 start_codon:yes stop_codon:yes gene_type:complete